MTNLSRITAKIFGETATATGDDPEIGQFGSALAGSYLGTTDVAAIQNLPAWSNGFIDSVTPSTQFPPLPEMTGFGKVLSYQTAYTLQKGVPEWDSGTTYYTGDFCKGIGEGKLYVSKVDSNLNHAVTDSTYWEEFSSGAFRNIGEIVTSTIPLTDAGLHLLDGALISGSGIYSDFVDYIADLYDSESPTISYEKGSLITLPTFTSNTQDGITIADARSNTTSLQAIFNGTNQSNQIGLWSTYWISIDYGQNTILGSYTIQADNAGSPEYPSAWVVQGSNDGSTWVDIDSRTGITFSLNESKTFTVSTSTPYEQYKIVFSNGVEANDNGEIKHFYFSAYTAIEIFENSIFATEAQWQQSVTDYGVCGKFVYDSINNTVRLPKITGIVEGTTDVTALGDLVEAGLPNITGYIKLCPADSYNPDFGGCFTGSDSAWSASMNSGSWHYSRGDFDASNSNPIYGNSSTVQPQAIKVLYYIVVATTTKTQIEVDIDEIVTDLNGKADVDLTNVNDAGTSKGASWAMPSSTYTDLTLGASDTVYTAPANGWYYMEKESANGSRYVDFIVRDKNDNYKFTVSIFYSISSTQRYLLPVLKGDKVKISYTADGNTNYFRFIYAVGAESEV